MAYRPRPAAASPVGDTAFVFQQLLADRWATAIAEQTTRDAGQPGVWLRCYLDLRQQLTAAAVVGPTMEPTTARP
ncbi:DUF6207 family protein [Streptomyces mirabilis]|uniref:DUF6207 family protein n=1 Tax=Streptomyces mirabilis TaxID=68239 RepID=UPI0033344DC2